MDTFIQQWQQLPFFDQLFWIIGLGSTLLLVIYYLLIFAGHQADLEIPDHDDVLPVLSIRSLLSFATFLGWTVVVVRRNGGTFAEATLAGVVAGVISVWLIWKLLNWMLKMQSEGATLDLRQLVGKEAVVYLVVPAGGARTGKIHINFQEKLRELDVVTSAHHDIPTGSAVLVTEIRTDGVPVVMPIESFLSSSPPG